jgi:integrase
MLADWEFCRTPMHPNSIADRKGYIGIIKQFVETGIYPSVSSKTGFMRDSSINKLCEEFRQIIDTYINFAQVNGISDNYIYTCSHNASCFFLSFQNSGINRLIDIDEASVISFFYDGTKVTKSASYKRNIFHVIKTCTKHYPDCSRLLPYIPCLRVRYKNIDCLTPEEADRLRKILDEKDDRLCLRDKAIINLAFYTGLRGCDIAALTCLDIDWEKDIIHIKQCKTKNLLELPLRPVVGNAIFEYITKERPKVANPHIFLTIFRPHQHLEGASLWSISKKAMILAGVRTTGGRKGLHLLRHHLASSLLGNEVQPAIISATLGHTSMKSTNTYLSTDMVHLKQCALSIENFPVRKEVFDL